jgi:type II secretory pathway component GspD/PulD (secretin)
VVVDEKLNLVILRDSPEAVKLATKLVALQDVAEPEVMLDVEILEDQAQPPARPGHRLAASLSLRAADAPPTARR